MMWRYEPVTNGNEVTHIELFKGPERVGTLGTNLALAGEIVDTMNDAALRRDYNRAVKAVERMDTKFDRDRRLTAG